MNTSSQVIMYWVRVGKRPFLLFSLIFLLFFPSAITAANNRYVAPTGSDTDNDCTNPATPCATITHTINQAIDGHVIHLAAGVYTEANILVNKSLTFHGTGQEQTIIQAHADPLLATSRIFRIAYNVHILMQNLTIQHSNTTTYNDAAIITESYLTLINVIIRDNIGTGIYCGGCWLTLDKSKILNNSEGIFSEGGMTTITNSFIEDNEIGISGDHYGTTVINTKFIANTIAIDGHDHELLLTNSSISNNSYGILGERDYYIIENSIITRNSIDGINDNNGTTVHLTNSVISFNGGSGIHLEYSGLFMENSTITRNGGSGIYLEDSMMRVWNSTINNNIATEDGGGIYSTGSDIEIHNSTISGNKAYQHGGGIYVSSANWSVNTLNNVTLTLNAADYNRDGIGDGGGVYVAGNSNTAYIQNSIIAGNQDSSSGTQYPDCAGTLYSNDYNLIQNTTGCTLIGETTHNLLGLSPLLRRLADNGGPTQTHALSLNSPAINTGNPAVPGSGGFACELADQRSELRDAFCDIGAFEVK